MKTHGNISIQQQQVKILLPSSEITGFFSDTKVCGWEELTNSHELQNHNIS